MLSLLLLALAGGCASSLHPPPAGNVDMRTYTLIPIASDPSTQPSPAAHRHDPVYIYLDFYRLRVPYGAISANDAFWEKVDEHSLPASMHQLLLRNGIRTGTAPIDQWSYFKKLIDLYPTQSQKSTLTGGEGQGVELSIRSGVQAQTLFYFDESGRLHGRTYESCDDLLAVHFGPSAKAYAYVRISLCPVVRATRKRLEYTLMNNQQQVQYTVPQKIFEVGLTADLPPGRFLIVAPSAEASFPTRLGNVFLTETGSAERLETVLIIVPHVYRAIAQKPPA